MVDLVTVILFYEAQSLRSSVWRSGTRMRGSARFSSGRRELAAEEFEEAAVRRTAVRASRPIRIEETRKELVDAFRSPWGPGNLARGIAWFTLGRGESV